MKIAFACDHAGFSLRADIVSTIQNLGHEVVDVWPQSIDPLDDFPSYAQLLCDEIISGRAVRGILVCGTGVGMSIAANRNKGIRAVLSYSPDIAQIGRSHNDANVICFGARTMSTESVLASISIFLSEPFLWWKYQKRNNQIDQTC